MMVMVMMVMTTMMMMVMVMVMTTMMAGLVNGITNQARSVVRDLDPVNELAFLRLRSTKTEFLIAPGDLRQTMSGFKVL